MKQSVILLFMLLLSVEHSYGQTGIVGAENYVQSGPDGSITYSINRKSNAIEYPFGYSQPVLKCAPLRYSRVVLQTGEVVNKITVADDRRWIVNKAWQGEAGNVTPIIEVKPITTNITTNLIIYTNRRTYDVTLDAAPGKENGSTNPRQFFTRAISFYYPNGEAVGNESLPPPPTETLPKQLTVNYEEGVIDIAKANFSYRLTEGRHGFSWRPPAVYDNGVHLFIKIPESVEAAELPIFYAINAAGERTFVNTVFNPETGILKADRLIETGVLIYQFRHPGFLGLRTVTSEKELFIHRNVNQPAGGER